MGSICIGGRYFFIYLTKFRAAFINERINAMFVLFQIPNLKLGWWFGNMYNLPRIFLFLFSLVWSCLKIVMKSQRFSFKRKAWEKNDVALEKTFWTKKFVIWWLFYDDLRLENKRKKRTRKSGLVLLVIQSTWHLKYFVFEHIVFKTKT